jgi:hypothetical protein
MQKVTTIGLDIAKSVFQVHSGRNFSAWIEAVPASVSNGVVGARLGWQLCVTGRTIQELRQVRSVDRLGAK